MSGRGEKSTKKKSFVVDRDDCLHYHNKKVVLVGKMTLGTQ